MIAQPGRAAHEQGILEATSLTPQQQHNIALTPRGGDATPPSAGPPVSPGNRATTTDIAWSKEDTSIQVRDCYDIIGALVPGDSKAERPQLVEHCLTTLHNSFVPKINSRKTSRPGEFGDSRGEESEGLALQIAEEILHEVTPKSIRRHSVDASRPDFNGSGHHDPVAIKLVSNTDPLDIPIREPCHEGLGCNQPNNRTWSSRTRTPAFSPLKRPVFTATDQDPRTSRPSVDRNGATDKFGNIQRSSNVENWLNETAKKGKIKSSMYGCLAVYSPDPHDRVPELGCQEELSITTVTVGILSYNLYQVT
ncbi:hypothetical protein B0H10DRAFT_1954456 [Mycena sp. CBHHK59/15]|nr:hypothetical protein B0H10DRAFT_1954456 [Mycena sp. CBHHK59/15]